MDQENHENTLAATRKDLLTLDSSNSVGNKSQDKCISGCKGMLELIDQLTSNLCVSSRVSLVYRKM